MKTCCYIVPYFGKFPVYFPLFLKSCQWNPSFDWIIFTDNTDKYIYPANVKRVEMSFSELRDFVQSKFEFAISLNTPYKLCDYKPAYGYIFEEYLQDYAFWGHCDLDIIMGNLAYFLTDTFMEKYDKIFCLGHMTLYKNNAANNRIFMSKYKGTALYKHVFSTDSICWFDEEWKDDNNINKIFLSRNKKVFQKDLSFNIYIPRNRFVRRIYVGKNAENNGHGYKNEVYKRAVYLWNKGNLYRLFIRNTEMVREDFLYMHFQKRKMKISNTLNTDACNIFKIIPNLFLPLEVNEVTVNNFNSIKKTSVCFHYFEMVVLVKFRRLFKKINSKLKCNQR